MIRLTVKRPDGDLLWKGDVRDAALFPDGTFTFKGGAQPILPPYSIEVLDSEDEPDGSSA